MTQPVAPVSNNGVNPNEKTQLPVPGETPVPAVDPGLSPVPTELPAPNPSEQPAPSVGEPAAPVSVPAPDAPVIPQASTEPLPLPPLPGMGTQAEVSNSPLPQASPLTAEPTPLTPATPVSEPVMPASEPMQTPPPASDSTPFTPALPTEPAQAVPTMPVPETSAAPTSEQPAMPAPVSEPPAVPAPVSEPVIPAAPSMPTPEMPTAPTPEQPVLTETVDKPKEETVSTDQSAAAGSADAARDAFDKKFEGMKAEEAHKPGFFESLIEQARSLFPGKKTQPVVGQPGSPTEKPNEQPPVSINEAPAQAEESIAENSEKAVEVPAAEPVPSEPIAKQNSQPPAAPTPEGSQVK